MEYKDKLIELLIEDLKWYGHCIAGSGPIAGYYKAAIRAELHWYNITLPLIDKIKNKEKLNSQNIDLPSYNPCSLLDMNKINFPGE